MRDRVLRIVSCSPSGGSPRITATSAANGPGSDHSRSSPSRTEFEPLVLGAAEGIADKILDCDQHRRDELRVLAHRILGRHMGDQQPGMTVDQEHVFDLVDQRMLEHDLGEGTVQYARPPSAT